MAVVFPATSTEVSNAIKCAVANKVAIAPRSGGHSYEGYSIGGVDLSLVIDLKKFNTVSVANNLATVGGGVRLSQLYYRLWNAGGYAVPGGTCPSVGVGGHTLGGGFGLFSRKYGLMADNLASVKVVLANGTLIDASSSKNSDLFWALRGAGGGSYGIVTEFVFNVFKPPTKVTTFSYDFSSKDYLKIMKAYNTWGVSASRDVGVEMYWDKNGISFYGTFLGTKDKLNTVLSSFLQNAPKYTSSISESGFLEAILRWTYLDTKNIKDLDLLPENKIQDSRYTKGKSLMYKNILADEDIQIINKYLSKPPSGATASYVIVDLWAASKINEQPQNGTSFSHRSTTFAIEYLAEWGDNSIVYNKPDCQPCLKWINDFYNEASVAFLKRQSPIEAYQNYIDRDLQDPMTAYYGSASNIQKLKAVKSSYDPGNNFRFPQSIPLVG
ncbi:hypothetical protein K7432_017294 [Basidiobolus ranarum]|uniref:FAD-binding PCMH-type domain-containing protein n=1 Tax=Basidiobolus ranarum TaxID=34480 RepID=A0ABR2WDI9_9FUNG